MKITEINIYFYYLLFSENENLVRRLGNQHSINNQRDSNRRNSLNQNNEYGDNIGNILLTIFNQLLNSHGISNTQNSSYVNHFSMNRCLNKSNR